MQNKKVIDGILYVKDIYECYVPAAGIKERVCIKAPVDALPILRNIRYREQEVFIVVYLDGAHQVTGHDVVTIGLLNQSQIHPREVFRQAVINNCGAILVAHNHPSGNKQPSPADLDATKKLVQAGEILGIPVLDHIIVTRNAFTSIRDTNSACFIV